MMIIRLANMAPSLITSGLGRLIGRRPSGRYTSGRYTSGRYTGRLIGFEHARPGVPPAATQRLEQGRGIGIAPGLRLRPCNGGLLRQLLSRQQRGIGDAATVV